MKTTLRFAFLLGSAFLAGAALTCARADEPGTHIAFSDPGKPGTLRLSVTTGSVTIKAADRPDVLIDSSVPIATEQRSDGLRVLSTSHSFAYHQKDNVIRCDFDYMHGHSDIHILVPRSTSVIVNSMSGKTVCDGLQGDVEIRGNSGSVLLEHMQGGASVETMNGGIMAHVEALRTGHPLSFTSMNGAVNIRLPKNSAANLQLRTQNGSILTDFDEKELVTTTTSEQTSPGGSPKVDGEDGDDGLDQSARDAIRESARATSEAVRQAAEAIRQGVEAARAGMAEAGVAPMPPLPPLPPMTGGKTVSGVLNGGGVQIEAATMNGDVIVRKEHETH